MLILPSEYRCWNWAANDHDVDIVIEMFKGRIPEMIMIFDTD